MSNMSNMSSMSNISNKKGVYSEETDLTTLPTRNNPLYDTSKVVSRLMEHPTLKIMRDGKYYMKMKDTINEVHPKVKRDKSGRVLNTYRKETLGPIERVISRFCEDVLCISRTLFLPLTSQGERHLIWVGKKKANHIIRRLKGNGCYVVNRFPGDIFLKDKQVMGTTLRQFMLMRSNQCDLKCGVVKETNEEETKQSKVASGPCPHMVTKMLIGPQETCTEASCPSFGKHVCEHLDVFVPEVQSFCTYNALQTFSNRLDQELQGQTFVCKPAYLYRGFGFRFFRNSAEFQEFYHMTEGKETSRHDFMVQRLVQNPYLFMDCKVDIRAFLLVVVLRHRRVVSFVHYGFCRVASDHYSSAEHAAEDAGSTNEQTEASRDQQLEKDMRMYVCTYHTKQEKQMRKNKLRAGQVLKKEADRSFELQSVFEGNDLMKVKSQIKHIAIKLTETIENKIWDWFGCFQIFSMDFCVDNKLKVWLIEVNSHAISEVDTMSAVQRKVVPAVIMEAIGLVMESTYKSFHNLRLRKSPTNEFQTTDFLFRQNYEFIFSTLARKRSDYVWPKTRPKRDLPYHERIGEVDRQIRRTEKRKQACRDMERMIREEKAGGKKRKDSEE